LVGLTPPDEDDAAESCGESYPPLDPSCEPSPSDRESPLLLLVLLAVDAGQSELPDEAEPNHELVELPRLLPPSAPRPLDRRSSSLEATADGDATSYCMPTKSVTTPLTSRIGHTCQALKWYPSQ